MNEPLSADDFSAIQAMAGELVKQFPAGNHGMSYQSIATLVLWILHRDRLLHNKTAERHLGEMHEVRREAMKP